MICDDSAVIRAALSRILESDPAITVVARAVNGAQAIDAARASRPDVVVLDIEMPVMDGLAALPLLLRADPTLRVVMASTLTTRGADIAMRALRLGAADYVPKPSANAVAGDGGFARELLAKVHGLARLRRSTITPAATPAAALTPRIAIPARPVAAAAKITLASPPLGARRPLLLAVGSSTGGPQALFTLTQALGTDLGVPVVLTQHMPASFTAMLAEHITRLGGLTCAEVRDGEALRPNHIHLAPGDRHLLIERGAAGLIGRLSETPPENFCRPAVDPMLRSAASAADGRVLVVMLTGMGQDGLEGTRAVLAAGGGALAQDEATSVVWGMPGAIARAGLAMAVLPLPQIGSRVREMLRPEFGRLEPGRAAPGQAEPVGTVRRLAS